MIEACEYKRSFLQYHPFITIITNIDLDHLDYYKNLDDYISAFQSLVDQTSGFVVISESDENSLKLNIPKEKKIIVGEKISYFAKVEMLETDEIFYEAKTLEIPEISLQIPGNHILQALCSRFLNCLAWRMNILQKNWHHIAVLGAVQKLFVQQKMEIF